MTAAWRGVCAAAMLGLRRAAQQPGRWVGVAGAVGLAAALLWLVGAEGTMAGDRAARTMLARAPAAQTRAVLTWNGGAGAAVDRAARRALGGMGAGPVSRGLLMLQARVGGTAVRPAAVAPLRRGVRLLAGRLPDGPCRPARCEVLRVSGPDSGRVVADPGLTLVVTGRGALTDPGPLGFTTRPRASAARSSGPVLLVTADPAGLEGIPRLAGVARTQAWTARLPLGRLHAWDLRPELSRLERVGGRLAARSEGFTVTAPTAILRAAAQRAEAAPRRVLGAAFPLAAALAALLALAAGGLRTGSREEDERLGRHGATGLQRVARVLAETGVPVLAGLAAGSAAGVGAAAVRAALAGASAGPVLAGRAGPAMVASIVAALAGWALVVVVVALPARAARLAAAGALLAAAAALAALLATRPPGASRAPAAATVPLAIAAGALLLGHAAPAILRALARAGTPRRPVHRMALLELARVPGPPGLAVAGVAAAVALCLFALSLDVTLARGRSAVAAQRVALDAALSAGPATGSPAGARGQAAWARLTGAREVAGVLRRDAFAVVGPTRSPVRLVGVPARDLALLDGLRPRAVAGAPARRLTASPFDGPAPGVGLAPAARTVAVAARARGDAVDLTLFVATADGRTDAVALGRAAAGPRLLRARLPARDRGGRVVAIGARPPLGLEVTQTHQLAEGGSGPGAAGGLSLGPLFSAGRPTTLAGWRGHGGLTGPARALRHDPSGGTDGLVRPAVPSDTAAVPVLADAATARDAAVAGTIGVDTGETTMRARVVGVVDRLPTVPGGTRLVVADAGVLGRALDAASPGAGTPDELWFGVPPAVRSRVDAAVSRLARREGFAVSTRAAARRVLAREPVGRAVRRTAWGAAILAVLLACAGTGLLAGRLRRDGAAALRDLEGQGAGPRALRQIGRLHAVVVAAVAVPGGLVLGTALAGLTAGAARATLSAAPDPPLTSDAAWRALLTADLVALGAAVLVLGTAAARRGRRA